MVGMCTAKSYGLVGMRHDLSGTLWVIDEIAKDIHAWLYCSAEAPVKVM